MRQGKQLCWFRLFAVAMLPVLPSVTVGGTDPPVQVVWQTTGGDHPLRRPTDIALDPHGNLYVIDGRNSRVQKFSADGKPLTRWGTAGEGPGQFIFELGGHWGGVTVGTRGQVFVVDATGRMQVFGGNGERLGQWPGAVGERVAGLCGDGEGNVLVPEFTPGRGGSLTKYDPAGRVLLKFEVPDWAQASDCAVGPQGDVFLSVGDGVQRYTGNGKFAGDVVKDVARAYYLAVDPQGRIYVTLNGQHLLRVYDAAGRALRTVGQEGVADRAPGSFNFPTGVVLDALGNILVVETSGERVQKLKALAWP